MSIADELRVCARTFIGVWVDGASQTITFTTSDVPPTADSVRMDSRLLAIADSIDKAYEEALQREHETAYDDGYDEGFASADDWCGQHEDAMAEHGWVKLPKDADGEYIHVGDMMGHRVFPDAKYTVIGIGENAFFTCDASGELYKHIASLYPHYKQPTVEDVLREFAYGLGVPVADSYVAACAAKLQLREDA